MKNYDNKYEDDNKYYKYIPRNTDPRKYLNENLRKSIDPLIGIFADML